MVRRLGIKNFFWPAIIFLVIANLLLGNYVSAKQLEIKAEDVDKIKTVLSMAQTLTTAVDIIINNKDLTTVLNTVIRGGEMGADVTYGLVVLAALNEMELVDLVVSQRYKTEQRTYFERILKERTNLGSYWKGLVSDAQRIIAGQITGPVAALTLNTFGITSKAILMATEFEVLKTGKLYDGLWHYFDTRKQGNEPHEVAWDEAKMVMGFAVNSLSGLYRENKRTKEIENLESQFLALYERWAPYVTPFGVSEEYKKQVKDELNSALATALKIQALVRANKERGKLKPSLVDKLYNQFEKLKDAVATVIAKINPFKAGVTLNLPEETEQLVPTSPSEEVFEAEPRTAETTTPEETRRESIKAEPLLGEIPSMANQQETIEAEPQSESNEENNPEIKPEDLIETEPQSTEEVSEAEPQLIEGVNEVKPQSMASRPTLCEKKGGNAARFRVLINEVAWMGSQNSSNDEWIELKNIWGIPVNLRGWQLLDKGQQIKIVFTEKDVIPAQGFYLLERTDDNSMPNVPANLIYTGALGNTNEALYLFNDQCNLEDEVLADPNWPGGDNFLKKPMQRLNMLDWYTGSPTAGSDNSSPPGITSSAGVSAPSAASPAPAPSSSPITYPQILITETYTRSTGNQKDDFVELYNPNSETVSLTDWYLRKKTAGGQSFSSYVPSSLLAGKTIQAKDYLLIANASSTFATSADVITDEPLTENNTLALKNPKEEIVDEVSTDIPLIGKSHGRKWSSTTLSYTDDFEMQTPTPRAQNQGLTASEVSSVVVINEIAWAGTQANSFDEWIELLANSTTTLDGWKILGTKNGTTTLEIALSGFASSSTYFLLERTDDNTVSDIRADLIYTGALDNSGGKLELRDADNNLIDLVDCSSGWFAGETSPNYFSMERINPLSGSDPDNWTNNNRVPWEGWQGKDAGGNRINGTPKSQNSVAKDSTTVAKGYLYINNDFTLRLLGSPYLVEGPINVLTGTKLTIEPGVIIKFRHNDFWGSEIKVEGELEAIGGSGQGEKIILTSFRDDDYGGDTNEDASSTLPSAGDWDWLYFKNSTSTLENVILRYGGKYHKSCCYEYTPYTRGTIMVEGGKINIKNSLIEKSYTRGLWLENSSVVVDNSEFLNNGSEEYLDLPEAAAIFVGGQNSSSTIKNSIFKNNKIGILVDDNAKPLVEANSFEENDAPIKIGNLLVSFAGNTAVNNDLNGILVSGFGFSDAVTQIDWQKTNLPFILGGVIAISPPHVLNIKPGVVIKFRGSTQVSVDGTLNVQGDQNEKIVFTSLNDDEYGGDTNNDGTSTQPLAGYWRSISFSGSSVDSILDNVVVKYGGWYNQPFKSGAIKIANAEVNISNSYFDNNLVAGLELENCTTMITNTTLTNHRAEYLYGTYSAGLLLRNVTPVFTNTIFNKNYYGIYVEACPNLSDLTGVSFGNDEEANTVTIQPAGCGP